MPDTTTKQVMAIGGNGQLTTIQNGQAVTGPDYQALYTHLLGACVDYFECDPSDEQLSISYKRILRHMTNRPENVLKGA